MIRIIMVMLQGDVVEVVGHHSATSENATTEPLHLLFIFIYHHAYVCCCCYYRRRQTDDDDDNDGDEKPI